MGRKNFFVFSSHPASGLLPAAAPGAFPFSLRLAGLIFNGQLNLCLRAPGANPGFLATPARFFLFYHFTIVFLAFHKFPYPPFLSNAFQNTLRQKRLDLFLPFPRPIPSLPSRQAGLHALDGQIQVFLNYHFPRNDFCLKELITN